MKKSQQPRVPEDPPKEPKITGPAGQFYADPTPGPDEESFRIDNNSAKYYTSAYYLAHKNQVQPIPQPRASVPLQLQLSRFLPADMLAKIEASKCIQFHAAGDTGAAKVNRSQTVLTAIGHEAHVADSMAQEVHNGGDSGPAFLYLVGDVIYNFGEAQYYYDQFYEPFRGYDRPIFAIPGNHDAMVFGPTSTAPRNVTLAAFLANFCAASAKASPDAPGIMRSTMTQPGVYFTLDAPFVSIIGLYSNALEGPGVISSQGKHFPIGDEQLEFLKSEFRRLKPERDAGKRAIVLAIHHPPLSVDSMHGGSTGVQADLDACCRAANLWPDLVLSGHAHLYQRFTHETALGKQIPYIVAGNGGFAVTPPRGESPGAGTTIGPDTLAVAPILKFGYLTISASATELSVVFRSWTPSGVKDLDTVVLNLRTNRITRQGVSGKSAGSSARHAASKTARRREAHSSATRKRKGKSAGTRKPAAKTKRRR